MGSSAARDGQCPSEAARRGQRSHRIEVYAGEVLALVDETPDMTLAAIAAHLERAHGLRVVQSTVWRFFERRGITLKKIGTRQRAAAP
jgi:transposase